MVKSRQIISRRMLRPLFFALLLVTVSAAFVPMASAQFTLAVSSPLPAAVVPGSTATATLSLQPNGSSAPVTLTCVVTTQVSQPVMLPTCDPSPSTPITPPAAPSLTVTTFAGTSFGLYNFAIIGTSGSSTATVNLSLTVVNLTEDYTLSVLPVMATPNTVAPGATATTTVTISPLGSYTNHQVTLSCLSVTPVVAAAPVCSFTPVNGTASGPVQITSGPASATLTITTLGPTPTTRLERKRLFYALWLLAPGLALAGFGTKARHKKLMGIFFLLAMASGILLMPACSSSTSTSNNPSGEVTPANTYTFTLTGADENGAAPGNTTTCTTGVTCTAAATVTLVVN
jgi:hypothetical protein